MLYFQWFDVCSKLLRKVNGSKLKCLETSPKIHKEVPCTSTLKAYFSYNGQLKLYVSECSCILSSVTKCFKNTDNFYRIYD